MSHPDWNVVQELYNELIDLPPGEQGRVLRERCGDDQALFDEVSSLLQAGKKASQFLNQSADRLLEQDFEPGTTIGSYRLIRPLGRGGSGTVYLAWQRSETVERLVAIKVLRPGLDDEATRERFSLEQQVLADLQHPNIARLYDAGVTSGGRPYAVMAYVDGQPIDTFCAERSLSLQDRLSLFTQVCDAVQYAHRKLVLHRDLKPSNIFVTQEEGAAPRVHLLDFGLAKLLDPEHRADLTATQERALTPHYASPEQVRGASVSTATDVYSLGVVLYELLTGAKPLDLSEASAMAWERIIAEETPALPSKKALSREKDGAVTHAPSALKGDLDNIVLKALRKEPTRRYESVRALADDIERHLKGHPVEAREPTWRYRTSRFVKRNRAAVIAGCVAVLFLVGGASAALWQAGLAAEERDRAQDEAGKSEDVLAFVVDLFEASDPVAGGALDRPIGDILQGATERLSPGLEAQPELQARLYTTLGEIYYNLSSFTEAQEVVESALPLYESGEAGGLLAHARTSRVLGAIYMATGDWAEARTALDRALDLTADSPQNNTAERAAVLHTKGNFLRDSGTLGEALPFYTQAVAIYTAQEGPASVQVASVLNDQGVAQYHLGDYEEAEGTYRQALDIYDGHSPMLQAMDTRVNLAILYYSLDREPEALPLVEEALNFQEDILEETNRRYIQTLRVKGLIQMGIARYEEEAEERFQSAEEALVKSLDLARQVFGEEHHELVQSFESLGLLYTFWGRHETSLAHYRSAYDLNLRILPEDHWNVIETRISLGQGYRNVGRFKEAEDHIKAGYEALIEHRGADHPRVRYAARQLAVLYDMWERSDLEDLYLSIAEGDSTPTLE